MGYTTYFHGGVNVVPPLNEAERDYLHDFANSRRMKTTAGPYLASPGDDMGQDNSRIETLMFAGQPVKVIDHNQPPDGQPGLWVHWVPSEDGAQIGWDQGEKFYYGAEWMKYLIDHFLKPGALAQASGDPQFADFTFDHTVNGEIEAEGEEPDDRWILRVRDNVVAVAHGRFTYDDSDVRLV